MPPPSAAAAAFLRSLMPLLMRSHTRWYMKYNIFILNAQAPLRMLFYFKRVHVEHVRTLTIEWWRLNTQFFSLALHSLLFIVEKSFLHAHLVGIRFSLFRTVIPSILVRFRSNISTSFILLTFDCPVFSSHLLIQNEMRVVFLNPLA